MPPSSFFYDGEELRDTSRPPYNRDMRTKQVVVLFWVVLCLGLLSCFSQSSPSRQQQIESHNRKAAEYSEGEQTRSGGAGI